MPSSNTTSEGNGSGSRGCKRSSSKGLYQTRLNNFLSTTDIISVQVIAADGEQKAARALKEASETISESSSAMQLRYLQVSWMKNKLDIKSSPKLHPNFDYFIRAKYRCTENTISFFNYGMKKKFFYRPSTPSAQRRIIRLCFHCQLMCLET